MCKFLCSILTVYIMVNYSNLKYIMVYYSNLIMVYYGILQM